MSSTLVPNTTEPIINREQCAWWVVHGAIPQADSDVTGIGGVIAFLLCAYITIGLAIAAYFLGAIDPKLLGPVDYLVHKIPKRPLISESWQKALDACVLLFSDQQIMTGLAMLIAGFVGLVDRMDVYHFQVVIMLAWMSSSVNLTALTVLGQFFEEHKPVFYWRLAGMLILLILLLAALVPTTSNRWAIWATQEGNTDERTGWAVPARCYFLRGVNDGGVNADAPLSYVLLISSYIWKLGSISKDARSVFNRYVRGPPEKLLESMIRRGSSADSTTITNTRGRSLRHYICMVLYIDFLVVFEFAASFAASLWVSVVGLAWGTVQVIVPRYQNANFSQGDDSWTFGQLVPLILMVQPIGAMLELYRRREEASHVTSDIPTAAHTPHSSEDITTTPVEIFSIEENQSSEVSKTAPITFVLSFADTTEHTALSEHKMLIYKSTIFKILIHLSHISIAVYSILVLYVNAKTIGYSSTYDYVWILLALAVHVGVLLVITAAAIPLDKVFLLVL
ncbi:hypothetical protein E4T52_16103 [Aureobasidium sp. EXF-3400]|nr:hypothetical protein E4T51_12000 [Aureobasidium sp. EXF-12344]KAI4768822.1 hypothetical protein E4T52_16103 [Aureobasidium sp. EXF-3400]